MHIMLQEAEPACDRILYHNLTVKHGEKTLSYDQYLDEEGGKREKVLDKIHPYTNYTIILIAVNNNYNESIPKPQYILTPELGEYRATVLLLYYYCITTVLLLNYYYITIVLLLYYYYITTILLLYYYRITTVLLLYYYCSYYYCINAV